MQKKQIALWLYENLEKEKFSALFWDDKTSYIFMIIWEKIGRFNSEKTLELCKVC